MLHLVAFPPARQDLLEQLSAAAADGDALVLIEGGVAYCHPRHLRRLMEALPGVVFHALEADLEQAGLAGNIDSVDVVDYEGLVALTESHDRNASWYP